MVCRFKILSRDYLSKPAAGSFAFASLFMVVVSLLGCSAGDNTSTSSNSACGTEDPKVTAQRQENFSTTLHALLLAQSCKDCHDGKTGLAPYPHSSSEVSTAYEGSLQLVDFTAPSNSRFISKIQNNHNCGNASQCQALAASMLTEIKEWAAAEAALPAPPQCNLSLATGLSVTTPGVNIKYSTLSATVPTVLRWDLSLLNSELAQTLFSINVKRFTAPSSNGPGSYIVEFPVLATGLRKIEVLSVVPTIKGRLSPKYANYSGLFFVVAQQLFDATASILGFPPLSADSMQLAFIDAAAGDDLGFALVLRASSESASTTTQAPSCKSSAKFKLVYDNVFDLKVKNNMNVYVGQCTECHGDKTQAANAVMDLSGNGVDPCLQALMRVNLKAAFSSLLLTKPSRADQTACQNAGLEHPVEFRFLANCAGSAASASLAAQKSLILDWINDEASKQQ